MMKKINFLFILSLLFVQCVSTKNKIINDNILTLKDSYCKAPFTYDYKWELPSYSADSIIHANEALLPFFSKQSILILNALQSLDEVKEIVDLKKAAANANKLRILYLKEIIDGKIAVAQTDLASVAAEFDCEGERVGQLASYIDELNRKKMNKMVVYSILIGAASSTASALISNEQWGKGVGIAGGLAGAGLGFLMLKPKGKKAIFIHKRNLLRDIWEEKLTSSNFPPFVWYMYTEKSFANNTEGLSIIQNIKKRWLRYNFANNVQEANNSILFRDGGDYYAEDLYNRTSMLNQMQSATRTINQNINYLLLDLGRLSE